MGGGNLSSETGGTQPQTYGGQGFYNVFTGEYTNKPQSFTSTIAGLAPEQQWGLSGITARALTGSPVTEAAKGNLYSTLTGQYMDPASNPWLSATYQRGAEDLTHAYQTGLMPQINAMANRAGAFGGSSHALLQSEAGRNLARELGGLATDIYGKNYEQERLRQMQAMMFAPQMAETDYSDMTRLIGVGDVYRQYEQDLLNEMVMRWQQEQQWPYSQLQQFASVFPAAVGGTGTTSMVGTQPNPYYVNPASKIFGGAASGIGTGLLASMAGVNPFLAGGLGLATLLGSLF